MGVYVVLARRFGSYETHSYVVGVFDNIDLANKHADEEEDYRGGKYSCEIVTCDLNTENASIVRDANPNIIGDVKSLWSEYLESVFNRRNGDDNKKPRH